MDKPHHIPEGSPGYETRDANLGGVYKFLMFLAVLLVASGLVCWAFFRYLSTQNPDSDSVSPFAETRQLPLGPQLQVNPREDWLKFHEQQEQSLETYAWENRSAGIARVPIERAMELLLQKGLPVQNSAASQTEPTSGVTLPDAAKSPAPQGPASKGSEKP